MDLVKLSLDAQVPLAKLLRTAENGKVAQKRCYEDLQELPNAETLYGRLITLLPICGSEGQIIHAVFIDPCALMAWAAETSLLFFHLVKSCIDTHGAIRFVLYHDGVVPGNVQRFDVGRSFVSFLWTWMELPSWLRNRSRVRWLTLLYILKRTMKDNNIKIPDVTKAILLKVFRHGDYNVSQTGILLQHGEEQLLLVMRPRIVTVQDYEGHCLMFELKGPSGLSPCPLCDNCLGRRQYFQDDSGIEHVLSSRYDKFVFRKPERFREIFRELKGHALRGEAEDLDKTEKATGFVFNESGLLFDEDLADIVQLPEAMYVVPASRFK